MSLDLQRLSVLIVEDSLFIRSIIANSLKVLGVGQVSMAEDGGRAIEFLQLVKSDPMRAGVQSVDIVISNWDMSPVDGMMLLRWIRRHKDSPDRYMPFMFLTGFTDLNHIREAREQGAHEVMTKPFTVKTLAEKILGIVQRNRQFVHTKDYFGPDRRRQQLPYRNAERRLLTDKSPEVEVVHG
jgi:two-component system, chemotaxis family, chemotaxis protein CheY